MTTPEQPTAADVGHCHVCGSGPIPFDEATCCISCGEVTCQDCLDSNDVCFDCLDAEAEEDEADEAEAGED